MRWPNALEMVLAALSFGVQHYKRRTGQLSVSIMWNIVSCVWLRKHCYTQTEISNKYIHVFDPDIPFLYTSSKWKRQTVYLKCSLHAKFKKTVRQENMVFSLKWENNRSVTHGFMFAYTHEKIHILLSVLRGFFLSIFMILVWIHKDMYT